MPRSRSLRLRPCVAPRGTRWPPDSRFPGGGRSTKVSMRINRMAILAQIQSAQSVGRIDSEQVAGQVRHRDPGHDQKARVVGQAREVVPTPCSCDEGIARGSPSTRLIFEQRAAPTAGRSRSRASDSRRFSPHRVAVAEVQVAGMEQAVDAAAGLAEARLQPAQPQRS